MGRDFWDWAGVLLLALWCRRSSDFGFSLRLLGAMLPLLLSRFPAHSERIYVTMRVAAWSSRDCEDKYMKHPSGLAPLFLRHAAEGLLFDVNPMVSLCRKRP